MPSSVSPLSDWCESVSSSDMFYESKMVPNANNFKCFDGLNPGQTNSVVPSNYGYGYSGGGGGYDPSMVGFSDSIYPGSQTFSGPPNEFNGQKLCEPFGPVQSAQSPNAFQDYSVPQSVQHETQQSFGYLPFSAHPEAHFPLENEMDIPVPAYAPCQGPRPWNFSYCYGFYGEPACPLVNIIDMEDFM